MKVGFLAGPKAAAIVGEGMKPPEGAAAPVRLEPLLGVLGGILSYNADLKISKNRKRGSRSGDKCGTNDPPVRTGVQSRFL